MPAKPQTIDEYLAQLGSGQRGALEKLRRDIHTAAPKAEECISYGVPGFRLDGRLLVSFGAAVKHCSFYPGAEPLRVHREALGDYSTSKGTIRFPDESPLPSALVQLIVRTRIAEHRGKSAASRA